MEFAARTTLRDSKSKATDKRATDGGLTLETSVIVLFRKPIYISNFYVYPHDSD